MVAIKVVRGINEKIKVVFRILYDGLVVVDQCGIASGDVSQMVLEEQVTIVTNASSVNHGVDVSHSPTLKSIMEQHGDMLQQPKKQDRGAHDNIVDVDVDLESLSSYPLDEEVIGIITMEDVMEELLQAKRKEWSIEKLRKFEVPEAPKYIFLSFVKWDMHQYTLPTLLCNLSCCSRKKWNFISTRISKNIITCKCNPDLNS